MSVQQKRFQTGELIFKSIESESYNALLVATEHKNARHLKNVDADLGADCRTYANRSARKDTGFIKYVRRLKTNVRTPLCECSTFISLVNRFFSPATQLSPASGRQGRRPTAIKNMRPTG